MQVKCVDCEDVFENGECHRCAGKVVGYEEWEEIGHFGVDSGMCWISDPCYVIKHEWQDRDKTFKCSTKPDPTLGESWHEFLDNVDKFGVVREDIKERVRARNTEMYEFFEEGIQLQNELIKLGIEKDPPRPNPMKPEPEEWEYQMLSEYTPFPFEKGHLGLGMMIPTGVGDGNFPVFARRDRETKQIIEVKIVFQEETTGNSGDTE